MAFAVVEHLTDGKYQKGVFATVDSTLAFSPPHRRLSQCGGPLTSHEWAYALERSWCASSPPGAPAAAARERGTRPARFRTSLSAPDGDAALRSALFRPRVRRFGLLDPEYEMRAARDEHIALEMYAIMEKHKREEVRAQRGPGAHGTTDEGLVY